VPTQKPPQKFVNFPPYASEKSQRSKDADRLNLSETTLGHPSKNASIGGGGGGGGGVWLDIKRECTQRTEPILAAGIERD
jgi:hypothetical protein